MQDSNLTELSSDFVVETIITNLAKVELVGLDEVSCNIALANIAVNDEPSSLLVTGLPLDVFTLMAVKNLPDTILYIETTEPEQLEDDDFYTAEYAGRIELRS